MWTKDDVGKRVADQPVLIFGKGTKEAPQCGFTARAVQVLQTTGQPFEVVNIFDDPSIRPALIEFSQWPTTPQVFVGGEFLGGSDILLELHEKGELQAKVDAAVGAVQSD
jgi:monothiol glutaredoxin